MSYFAQPRHAFVVVAGKTELTLLCTVRFFVQAIEAPHAWEELRRDVYPRSLRAFVKYLVDDVQHEAIVSALL